MNLGLSEYFAQDAGIAEIGNVLGDAVSDEIEKGVKQCAAEFFGGLPVGLITANRWCLNSYKFQLKRMNLLNGVLSVLSRSRVLRKRSIPMLKMPMKPLNVPSERGQGSSCPSRKCSGAIATVKSKTRLAIAAQRPRMSVM